MVFYFRNDHGGRCLCFSDSDGTEWGVPEDTSNRHYQEYLEWLAEGNVAEEWTPEAPQ